MEIRCSRVMVMLDLHGDWRYLGDGEEVAQEIGVLEAVEQRAEVGAVRQRIVFV